MLSGRNQASIIVEAVRAGATDYVVKPDDPEGLGEIALDVAIKNAIEKNRLVTELSELRQQLQRRRGSRRVGQQREHAPDRHGDRTGRRQRRRRPDPRRERRRQGAGRARHSSAIDAAPSALREGELRGAAGRAPRERALRSREGRLHRRGHHPHRQVRAGRRRHADARRDRRDEAGASGQAAARAAGRGVHQAWQQQARASGRADRRRHQPRSREDDAERRLPRGPVLPPARHRADRAVAARTARRDPGAHRDLHRAILAQVQAAAASHQSRSCVSCSCITNGRATSASSRT